MELTFDESFAPRYKGKLFNVQPANFTYTLAAEADAETAEGKRLQTAMEKMWRKQMVSFRKAKEKEYSEVIAVTERNIYKTLAAKAKKEGDPKKLEKWLEEEAKGVNVMIKNAMKTFESLVQTKAAEIYDKVAAALDKKYNSALRNGKIKAGFKIAGHVVVILVAGAIGIAAAAAGVAITAATAGIGAVSFAAVVPVVVGSLATIAGSTKSIVQTVQKNWPSLDKSVKKLEKATTGLKDALYYQKKKQGKTKLGPKERIKLLRTDVKGKVKTVEKGIADCENYAGSLSRSIVTLQKEVAKIKPTLDPLKKLEDAKALPPEAKDQFKSLTVATDNLEYRIHRARTILDDKLHPALKAGREIINDPAITEDPSKLSGFLGKVQRFANDDDVKGVASTGKIVLSSTAKLAKGIAKGAAKAV